MYIPFSKQNLYEGKAFTGTYFFWDMQYMVTDKVSITCGCWDKKTQVQILAPAAQFLPSFL